MAIRVLHTGDLHIGNFPGPEQNGENMRYKDIWHDYSPPLLEVA